MMLERVQHSDGVVYYRSPLLADQLITHAFTTRLGGVSPAPWASLNLANPHPPALPSQLAVLPEPIQDDPQRVRANYQRVQQALGVANHRLVWVHQVHGSAVHVVSNQNATNPALPQADAMVTNQRGLLLAIRVADCVPVLLADRAGRAVAAIHAGWRSTVAGVIDQTLSAMRSQWGVHPSDVLAAIGPGIGVDHFEVGPEVAAEFHQAGLGIAVQVQSPESNVQGLGGASGETSGGGVPGELPGAGGNSRGKAHIDLARAIRLQLERAGVLAGSIDGTDCCTYRDEGEFFSHRRDRGRTGRMACLIALADAD